MLITTAPNRGTECIVGVTMQMQFWPAPAPTDRRFLLIQLIVVFLLNLIVLIVPINKYTHHALVPNKKRVCYLW